MNLLLEATASGWVAQASDFITAKFPELIAIFTSTAVASTLVVMLFKLIFRFIDNKLKKKANAPLEAHYKQLENKVLELETFITTTFAEFVTKVNDVLVANKQAEIEANKQFFESVVDADTEKVIEEVPQKEVVVEVVEEKNEETVPNSSEITNNEELHQEDVKVANSGNSKAKSTHKVAKKVVVGE